MLGSNAENIQNNNAGLCAAIDLGSNSFQLLLAQVIGGQVVEVARFREKIQLASGLDEEGCLQEAVMRRAFQCLDDFAEELVGIEKRSIRAVGTDALRRAVNSEQFIEQAEKLLGADIKIISGEEEAKLIYSGAIASAEQPDLTSLVLDIGGGSTEFALGRGRNVSVQTSVRLGCVDYSKRCFPTLKTDRAHFDQVVAQMRQELGQLPKEIRANHWQQAIGASGTILAIEAVMKASHWCSRGISKAGLLRLVDQICVDQPLVNIDIKGLNADRLDIFIAGVAITLALFEELDLEHLKTSPHSLREGLIYSMLEG